MSKWNEDKDPVEPGIYKTLHSTGNETKDGEEITYTSYTRWNGKTWVDISYQWWPIGCK